MVLPVYMLFVLGVAIAAFFILRNRERWENPRKRLVGCPENNHIERVEVDSWRGLLTLARGRREVRVKSCSRWPQRYDCAQDCLAQIDPASQVDRILARWYDARNCAVCFMPLARRDWQRGRAAALDGSAQLIELREMNWREFPNCLSQYEPLCWNCHQAELAKRRALRAVSS